MSILHKIGLVKSLSKNGIEGLLGADQINQSIIQEVPADLANYPHFQVEGVTYGLSKKLTVSGSNLSGQLAEGARVIVASPLGFRIVTHISEIKIDGNKIKARLFGLDPAIVTRKSWVAIIDGVAEYDNIADGQTFGKDSPIFVANSLARVELPFFTGYQIDGWMCCGDFVPGEAITMFRALSRIDAVIKDIEVYDEERNGIMQHRAKIKIELFLGELSGDLTRDSSSTKVTIVRREVAQQ